MSIKESSLGWYDTGSQDPPRIQESLYCDLINQLSITKLLVSALVASVLSTASVTAVVAALAERSLPECNLPRFSVCCKRLVSTTDTGGMKSNFECNALGKYIFSYYICIVYSIDTTSPVR